MSKKVHQINKKIAKSKSVADAAKIMADLQKKNPGLYKKVQDQPGR